METKDQMSTLPQSFTMSGGDGTHGYAHNSSLQRGGIFNTMNSTREAILAKLDLCNPHFNLNIFRIADFGCSVGPNTFDVVQHIISTVKLKYQQENYMSNPKDLEFHVFFNDQPNNDFNTLFKSLPETQKYFVAGVPGSFYSRVFPRNNLHIGHTSYTLHWLSKAPENVISRQNSQAHKEQFKKDVEAFLEARAEELVPGGLMIILGLCISDGVPVSQTVNGVVRDIFMGCLIDIAKSGAISKEKAESFSMPIYIPHFSELKEAMEQNGRFSIEMMEELKHPYENVSAIHDVFVSLYRGVFHGVMVEHLGEGLVDKLFDRFAKELRKCPLEDLAKQENDAEYVMVLKLNVL